MTGQDWRTRPLAGCACHLHLAATPARRLLKPEKTLDLPPVLVVDGNHEVWPCLSHPDALAGRCIWAAICGGLTSAAPGRGQALTSERSVPGDDESADHTSAEPADGEADNDQNNLTDPLTAVLGGWC